jgi:transcription initiation factor TFIID subunit 5
MESTWRRRVINSSLLEPFHAEILHYAGEDLAINLWDLGSGKRIKKMNGHSSSIYSLSFSAESSLLVSGGADWTVRCWDVKGAGGARSNKGQKNGTGAVNGNHTYADDENADTYVTNSLSVYCLTIHPEWTF